MEIILRGLGCRSRHLVDTVYVLSTQVGLDESLLDNGYVLSGRRDHLLTATQVLDVASTVRGLLTLLLLKAGVVIIFFGDRILLVLLLKGRITGSRLHCV